MVFRTNDVWSKVIEPAFVIQHLFKNDIMWQSMSLLPTATSWYDFKIPIENTLANNIKVPCKSFFTFGAIRVAILR